MCYSILTKMGYKGDHVQVAMDIGIPIIARCYKLHEEERSTFSTYLYAALQKSLRGHIYRAKPVVEQAEERGGVDPGFIELERRLDVQSILGKLCQYDRTLLVLYYWRGFTYEDLAVIMGTGKSTIYNHINAALEKCRERIH